MRIKPGSTPYQPKQGRLWIFHGFVLALALFPTAVVDQLALQDLPNHLARVYIINNIAASADLQKYYAVHWRILDFQSFDLLMPILARLFGIYAAARIFLALTFVLLFGGAVLLHRSLHARFSLWPAASGLLLINVLVAYGFLSYLFSVGLLLLLFAAWVGSEKYRGFARSIAFALAAFLLLLCHFFAFAVYAVLIVTYELGLILAEPRLRRWPIALQRLIAAGWSFPLLAALFTIFAAHIEHPISFYGILRNKVVALFSPTLIYGDWPDIAITALILFAVGIGLRDRLFTFSKPMRLPLAVLAAIAVIMPNQLASVWGADFRLPTVLALLAIAASDLRLPTRRHAIGFALCLSALMLTRVVVLEGSWARLAGDFDEFRVADARIERGSRIFAIQEEEDHRARPTEILFPYRHVDALAVIDRDVFLPDLFTYATPLKFAGSGREILSDQLAATRRIEWHPTAPAFNVSPDTIGQIEAVGRRAATFDDPSSTNDWSAWPERFDYLIAFDFGRRGNPVPALLTEIWQGSYFTIYRIHPPGRN